MKNEEQYGKMEKLRKNGKNGETCGKMKKNEEKLKNVENEKMEKKPETGSRQGKERQQGYPQPNSETGNRKPEMGKSGEKWGKMGKNEQK